MFAIVENDSILKIISPGNSFSHKDISYPYDWLYLSSAEEKSEVGIVDVIEGSYPDQRFYDISILQPQYNKEKNVVEWNYAWTEKPIDMVKATQTSSIDNVMNTFLRPSDWRVVKQMETGIPMPQVWQDYRDGIRQQGATAKEGITNATTVEEVSVAVQVQWLTPPQ